MYTRKNKMKGGMIQKNPGISSWEAVYKMICVPRAKLSCISYGSLKGFIFRLDVPVIPDNSEFFGLNIIERKFNKPIYSLVFKFALIDDSKIIAIPNLEIIDKNEKIHTIVKDTETLDAFKDEASKQQDIYTSTILPQGNPITLAVVDLSFFDSTTAIKLLEKFAKFTSIDSESDQMLGYLYNIVLEKPSFQLGLITMELANSNFVVLSTIIEQVDMGNISHLIFMVDCGYIWAQLLILFVKLKIINYDCHDNNVLANTSSATITDARVDKRSILIDFGRCVTVSNKTKPFPEFTQPKIDALNDKYHQMTGRTFSNDLDDINTTKFERGRSIQITDLYNDIPLMIKIIKFIAFIDYSILKTQFNKTSNIPQMATLLHYIFPSLFKNTEDSERTNPDDKFWEPNTKILENIQIMYKELTAIPIGGKPYLSLGIRTMFKIEKGESYSSTIPPAPLLATNSRLKLLPMKIAGGTRHRRKRSTKKHTRRR